MWWFPDRRLIRAVAQPGAGGQYPVGSPVRMVILVQPPTNAQTTIAVAPAIVVGFLDVYGNVVSAAGVAVSVVASSGTLSGTTAVQATVNGASFSNLIFDDIANTIISTRTLTFSAPGFANVISISVVVTKGTLQMWVESDFGVVDADGAALTSWADRSGNANAVIPGVGMTAPVYRASGFGGVANLPYWEFTNVNGARTGVKAGLAQTSFTNFMVGLREVADTNGDWYEYFASFGIGGGLRPGGPAIYAARMPVITLLESSYNDPTVWLTTNTRKLFRHEFDGTNAGHKLFDNGVQKVFGTNGLTSNPGLSAPATGDFHFGYRDSGTPSLNWRGKMAAFLAFSPKLSTAEAQSVEAYLQKWLGAAPANPTPQRGPILLANSVIDGVTIQVLNWSASADIKSIDTQIHSLIFLFSQPIKRFAATLNSPGSIPAGFYKMLLGVNNYQGLFNFTPVAGSSFSANGQRVQIDDTATGFTAVILRDSVTPGNSPTPFGDSILQNCRFSIMSDP